VKATLLHDGRAELFSFSALFRTDQAQKCMSDLEYAASAEACVELVGFDDFRGTVVRARTAFVMVERFPA